VANKMGSLGLGQYNKVFAFIGVFSLFVDFGMNAIFLKSEHIEKKFWSLVIVRLILGSIVFLLIQPILWILPYNIATHVGFSPIEKISIEIISSVLFTYSFTQSFQAYFQKKNRFDLLIYPNILFSIVLLVAGFYGYITGSLYMFFFATIAAWIGYILVSFILLYRVAVPFVIDSSYMKYLFIASIPLGLTLLVNILYVRADTLILSLTRTTEEVGIYSLAYKFFEFPLTISFFLMNALYPLFLETKTQSAKLFRELIEKWIKIILLISLGLFVCSFLAAPLLTFVKQDFIASIVPFRILILSYPIFFISNLILWIIITENKEKRLPIVYISSLFINVVLNLIFIPKFGYIAAAITTGLSEVVVLILLLYILKNIRVKE
jgi:O-antigen/teichoic acid export membrane protein